MSQARDVWMLPRNFHRSFRATEKAKQHHRDKGYLLTPMSKEYSEFARKFVPVDKWTYVDILSLITQARLPDMPGVYGFFNLDEDALATERVLYIGMSTKSLKTRVTKNHNQYCRALRNRASHIGYVVFDSKDPEEINKVVPPTEIALIQHWSPYLNRDENVFNYEVEERRFQDDRTRTLPALGRSAEHLGQIHR